MAKGTSHKKKIDKFKIKHPEGRSAFAKTKTEKQNAKRKVKLDQRRPKREAIEAEKATKRHEKWVADGKPIKRVFKSKKRNQKRTKQNEISNHK